MGKKYIVEIGRLERLYKAHVNGNGKPNLTWLSPEFDLTPYIEPDLEQVRKEAYEEGKKQAKVQAELDVCHDIEKVAKGNYKAGLSDAWEAARKICGSVTDGGLNHSTLNAIFGSRYSMSIMHRFTASEAIERLKALEQEQEEIKVGDEVELKCGVRPAIYMQGTKGSDEIYLLFNDGSCGLHSKSEIERKTGRHFSEIATVLEKMREDGNQNRIQETMSDDY